MMELFINLMILQALMGAFDTLYHHELTVALPQQHQARKELHLHAVRAIFYGVLFLSLAWFEWHGHWVWLLISLVLVEVVLTLWDFVIEDQTRLLPASERITHTLLAINGGAAFCLLALELPGWYASASSFVYVDYGWRSWFLSAAGIGVIISGLRDAFAAWQTARLDLRLHLDLGGHQRLLISGATGFIGSALCHELLRAGHDLTLLTRRPQAASLQFGGRVRAIRNLADLSDHEPFDAIINLAGAPVVGMPWTRQRRQVLLQSRLVTTRALLDFVHRARYRPHVWVQASAIGFYGPHRQAAVDETAARGDGFAADLCQQWETMTEELHALSVRRVVLRFGLVFGRSGGSLPMMMLPFRLGIGSILGDGRQHVGWIHIEDLLSLIALVIARPDVDGVINAVAPDSPTYKEFARLSGHLLQRPVWLTLPSGLLRLLLGEMASLFVDGPEIHSTRLAQLAFRFRFPQLRAALMDLL